MCFKKGLTLILDIDKNLPKYLMLDGSRLTQVLINLVSNAIKFTAEGYVKIKAIWKFDLNSKGKEFKSEYSNYSCAKPKTWFEKIGDINKESFLSASYSHRFSQNKNFIEAHRKRMPQRSDSIQETNQDDYICEYHDETGGCLIIQIEDTGIGISEENIKKLFNPFVQANQGISKLYGGTGLGLWISKTIMQVYKGDITVSSTVSKGSLFTIQQNCSVSVDKEDHVFVHKGLFSKLHVLLIDSQNTKVNKLALESQGIKVSVCMSAVIAINYLDTLEFSAVFIGLNFLKDDSLTLQNKIKKVQAEKNTLFVIIVIESQAELVPLKYRSYTTIASPINSQDVCKLANSLHKKPKTTYTGTVLILDDDHFILDILSRILEKEKITHITCSKGKQLIEIYNKKYKEISLIVLDANLEDISGFEVAKAVRTFEKTQELAEVPIICVSGDYDKDHLKKCSEAQITLTCKL
jgi:CheY-like chemotaxis protein